MEKEIKKMLMKKNIANPNNYGRKRNPDSIKYIVIHYTANDGDSAESNARYFHNNVVKASAHYFVDDDCCVESVPIEYIAWSVGGNKYSNCAQTGGGTLYGICTNANSISIELCDTKRDGKVMASPKTIANAVELTKKLMKKYHVDVNHVIRHFDVTGKACPAYWVDNGRWQKEFKNLL